MKLEILDTTLRDGCQSEGIDLSLEDKLKLLTLLKEMGVDIIEIESPNTNEKSRLLVNNLTDWSNVSIFTPTVKKGIKAEKDSSFVAISQLSAQIFTVVGKTSSVLAKKIMGADAQTNIDMITESISFLASKGKRVIFDAEHFFDAYSKDKQYCLSCLVAAYNNGADTIVLCDTFGGAMMSEIELAVSEVVKLLPKAKIGIHCHDDSGLAIANSITAVQFGASHVQGTMLGFGERIGNLPLASIIPTLQIKLGYQCIPKEMLCKITPYCKEIAEIANVSLNKRLPYISPLSFTHKAGMHQDGINKQSSAFEHVSPEQVGNHRKMLLSELSGRASVYSALKEMGADITKDSPYIEIVVKELKRLEALGYSYEGAKASFVILVDKLIGKYTPPFELISYRVINEMPYIDKTPATAIVKLCVNGISKLASSQGDGPVHALDIAMRNALLDFYPLIKKVNLIDYKVRVINPEDTTAAKVRVLISTTDGNTSWSTVGVSTDIIEASWIALSDSIGYFLRK